MNVKEITQALENKEQLTWHPEYVVEEWCDGLPPFTITDVKKIGKNEYYVGYKCSRQNCLRCQKITRDFWEHLKVIREDGRDKIGKGVEKMIGKKTVIQLEDQIVFTKLEKEDGKNT